MTDLTEPDELPRKTSRGPMILVALLLVGIGGAGTVWWLDREAQVKVPPLVGKGEIAAKKALKALGLDMHVVGNTPDPVISAGAIASQVPLAGTRVDRGTIIQVMLSGPVSPDKGPTKRPVPAATQPPKPKGPSASPLPPETTASPPDSGTIDSSATQAMVVVPKVTGRSLSRARRRLQAAGLVAGRTRYLTDEDRMPGIVLKQQPEAGKRVAKGSKVALTVNSTE